MTRLARILTLILSLTLTTAGCGGDGDDNQTSDMTADSATDTPAGDTDEDSGNDTGQDTPSDTSEEPPAPVVSELDCTMLPQALEGDDPLNTIFWVQLNDDLTCEATDPSTNYEEGIKFQIEYYDEELGVPIDTKFSFSHPFQAGFTVTDCSAGEPTLGMGSEVIGYENLPRGEDITITLTDNETMSRTVELVIQIQPPYAALMSVTEL